MAKFPVDIEYNQKSTGDGAKKTVDGLKAIEDQANKTREKMAKLTEVGSKMALAGGAIVAPFVLAMNKYVASAKETEPTSKRIVALSKQWEDSQVRLGRVTAKIVLPALEKGAKILEDVISFAEKNPGVVQAALTIGSTLVILGGIIVTTAQLVQTVATIQGLAAAAGLGSAGGGAATGAAVGGGLTLAGLGTLFTSTIIPLAALAIGSVVGLGIGNALAGTNQTLGDVWETLKKLVWLFGYWLGKLLPQTIYSALTAVGKFIGDALGAIGNWFQGGKATGGYMDKPGIYAGAERGREFVMNASTTKHAERAIGGRLNQNSAASYMTNNIQVGNGMTISQTRRMIRESEYQQMANFAGAFG